MKPIRHTVSRSVGKWAELTVSLSVDRVGKRAELVSKSIRRGGGEGIATTTYRLINQAMLAWAELVRGPPS